MPRLLSVVRQFSPLEAALLPVMWLYEKTLGKRRQGVYELKRLYKDMRARSYPMRREGKVNRITIVNHLDIGNAQVLVRRFSSDAAVFRQVLLDTQYKPLTNHIREHGDADAIKTIVDAGANIGFTTLFFSRLYPSARIVSIEPDADNYRMLLSTIEDNRLEHITPLRAGLWNANEPLTIDTAFRDRRSWSFRVKSATGAGTVKGITMRTLMDTLTIPTIDLLKVDIEGAEVQVFGDQAAVDAFLPHVRYLAIEIHHEFRIRPTIIAALERHGFTHFESGELTIARNTRLAR